MVRIAICDDEEFVHDRIKALCLEYGRLNGTDLEIDDFFSGEELIAYDGEAEIIFMDIEMGNTSGLEVKNILQRRNETGLIIFVTSHTELMAEAFGRNVCGFITKPVCEKQFGKIFGQALNLKIRSNKVNVGDSQKHIYINSDEIIYIKSDHVYSEVVTGSQVYLMRKSLDKWEQELVDCGFYRISKSYIVNMANISRVAETVSMKNGEELHIPRGSKKKFASAYREYCKKMARFA